MDEITRPESYALLESFEAELDRVDADLLVFYVSKLKDQLDKIKPGEKVGLAFHPDADGVFAGLVALTYLRSKNVEIQFLPYELETQKFADESLECDHVVSTDLWIPSSIEGQGSLEKVLGSGTNVTTIDHHDQRFPKKDIRKEPPSTSQRDPLYPETMAVNRSGSTEGQFLFITPGRLQCEIENSNRFPASTLTYKLFLELAEQEGDEEMLAQLKELEPYILVGIAGDCSLVAWPRAALDHEADLKRIKRLGTIINLAENFRNPENVILQAEQLISQTSKEQRLSALRETSPELAAAEEIQQWVEQRVETIIPNWNTSKEPVIFHFHADQEEIDAVTKAGLPNHSDVLKESVNPNIAIANALSRAIGHRVAIVVSQYCEQTNGQPPSVNFSFRTESPFLDVRKFARMLGGGDGHPMASGSRINLIEDPKEGEEIFSSVEDILWHTSNVLRNFNRKRS
jgi:hypothetical protein